MLVLGDLLLAAWMTLKPYRPLVSQPCHDSRPVEKLLYNMSLWPHSRLRVSAENLWKKCTNLAAACDDYLTPTFRGSSICELHKHSDTFKAVNHSTETTDHLISP